MEPSPDAIKTLLRRRTVSGAQPTNVGHPSTSDGHCWTHWSPVQLIGPPEPPLAELITGDDKWPQFPLSVVVQDSGHFHPYPLMSELAQSSLIDVQATAA